MTKNSRWNKVDTHVPKIGLPNAYTDLNASKIWGRIDIKRPKIGVSGLDIHGHKFDAGLDIHGSKMGLPNVDIDINAPKIGGGLFLRKINKWIII